MAMTTCFENNERPWPIKLEQRGSKDSFRVSYGFQVDDHLSYEEAASKLGQAIMHRAACDGLLDSECA